MKDVVGSASRFVDLLEFQHFVPGSRRSHNTSSGIYIYPEAQEGLQKMPFYLSISIYFQPCFLPQTSMLNRNLLSSPWLCGVQGHTQKAVFGRWGTLLNDWVSPIAKCLVHPSALFITSLQNKVTHLLRLCSARPAPGFLWSCDHMAALAASNGPMKVKYFTWQPSLQTVVVIILTFFLTREELFFFNSLDFH